MRQILTGKIWKFRKKPSDKTKTTIIINGNRSVYHGYFKVRYRNRIRNIQFPVVDPSPYPPKANLRRGTLNPCRFYQMNRKYTKISGLDLPVNFTKHSKNSVTIPPSTNSRPSHLHLCFLYPNKPALLSVVPQQVPGPSSLPWRASV